MTNEQAIAHFKEQLEVFGGEHHEAMKIAIEALEKQIPKKVDDTYEDSLEDLCPMCGAIIYETDKCCFICGQAIAREE